MISAYFQPSLKDFYLYISFDDDHKFYELERDSSEDFKRPQRKTYHLGISTKQSCFMFGKWSLMSGDRSYLLEEGDIEYEQRHEDTKDRIDQILKSFSESSE